MSAEPWRRTRTDWAPRLSAWQAWYFWQRWLDLCGMRGTVGTFVDDLRNLGDELGLIGRRGFLRGRRGTFGNAGSICVAGVVLLGPWYMSAEPWRLFVHVRGTLATN